MPASRVGHGQEDRLSAYAPPKLDSYLEECRNLDRYCALRVAGLCAILATLIALVVWSFGQVG